MDRTFTIVNRDKTFHSLQTTQINKIPRVRNLSARGDVSGEPGQAGDIILNRSNKQFYGHNGTAWKMFTTGGDSVFEYATSAGTGRDIVRLNTSNPSYIGDEDLTFPSSGTQSTDPGTTPTRFMFLANNGAVRAGTATGTQWDNRGSESVAFGRNSTASGDYSIVCGGNNNTVTAPSGTIIGGLDNSIPAVQGNSHGFIGGGESNNVSGRRGVIGGGQDNTIPVNSADCFIGGGFGNTSGFSLNAFATLGGGLYNTASGAYSFLGGGGRADGKSPGDGNEASGDYSVVCGGGGAASKDINVASGLASSILGGGGNTAGGDYSVVLGSSGNDNSLNNCFVFSGANSTTAVHADTFVIGTQGPAATGATGGSISLNLLNTQTATNASAGGTAIPTAAAFLPIYVGGVDYKIPLVNP